MFNLFIFKVLFNLFSGSICSFSDLLNLLILTGSIHVTVLYGAIHYLALCTYVTLLYLRNSNAFTQLCCRLYCRYVALMYQRSSILSQLRSSILFTLLLDSSSLYIAVLTNRQCNFIALLQISHLDKNKRAQLILHNSALLYLQIANVFSQLSCRYHSQIRTIKRINKDNRVD